MFSFCVFVSGYSSPLINLLLCRQIQNQFGGRLNKIVSGGAPLSPELHAFIRAVFGGAVVQGYGLTETLGACLCQDDNDMSYGRCGKPLRGVYVKLEDWPEGGYFCRDKPRPRGELVVGSESNSFGYLTSTKSEAELYSYDSKHKIIWFKTGDIVQVHNNLTFEIIDRKKDIAKLANGKYFSINKVCQIFNHKE